MAERTEVPLKEYLAGHVLRTAFFIFEAIGPWVKAKVQERFPVTEEETARRAQHSDAVEAWEARTAELNEKAALLDSKLKKCPKEEKASVALEKKELKAEQAAAVGSRPHDLPQPTWVEKCHEVLGRRT
jgi:hypothetical protein